MIFRSARAFILRDKLYLRGFTLIEILITVAILSTAIIFIFRSFTASLSSVKFSQNLTRACFLAEDKIWEIGQKQKQNPQPLGFNQDIEEMQGKDFNWKYQTTKLENSDLIKLEFSVWWQENTREKEYSLEFLTYLIPKK